MNNTAIPNSEFPFIKTGYEYFKPGDKFYYITNNLIAVDTVENIKYIWGTDTQSIEFVGSRFSFVLKDIADTVFSTYEAAAQYLNPAPANSKSFSLRPGELELIQSYMRKEISPDDVFVFSAELLDNDVDSDNERFTVGALKTLSQMFVGKTGYMRTSDGKGGYVETAACARIFSCTVESVERRKTSQGDDFFKLKARIYILRSERTNAAIEAIESGKIDKVSVGCAVGRTRCSICGGDVAYCNHTKGRYYLNPTRRCYHILERPVEAYVFYIEMK